MTLLIIIIAVLGLYASAYVFYSLFLVVARFVIKESGRLANSPSTRFAIIIPAHNEELLLPRLLDSIGAQRYPAGLFKSIVIADNCTDRTAAVALERHARVLERASITERGKGYAIKWALDHLRPNDYDAVLIVDADSILHEDVLAELDRFLANGNAVIQCYNGVANPDDSWFTRLLDVSRTIGNEILHPAKQKLGLSSYLMGNGMCLLKAIILKYGWDAFTVGEDWEYYAKLIQHGEVIAFANKARVCHQESSSLKQATSQRMRWSSGRFEIAWKCGFPLFFRGFVERNIIKMDGSLPLLFPNPSLGFNITAVLFGLSLLFFKGNVRTGFLLWFGCLILIQLGIYIVGVRYTKNKFKKLSSIFIAPLFLIWKMGIDFVSFLGAGRKSWVRTKRNIYETK